MYNTNATVTSNFTATEVTKLPEVPSEVEQLGHQLEQLDKTVERLAERLIPVLANRAGDAVGGPSAPEPVRVPLAEALHQRYLTVVSITSRVQNLVDRVEL